jgi:signal transduction histidine kinase
VDLAEDLRRIRVDRVQIQQVLLNLILNAVEAMRTVAIGERHLHVSSAASDDGTVRVSVQDTGSGLGPGEADRVFDAFYTTKPDGMGIGLTISRSIVESQGGKIWATQNERRGATFHFTLMSSASGSGHEHELAERSAV